MILDTVEIKDICTQLYISQKDRFSYFEPFVKVVVGDHQKDENKKFNEKHKWLESPKAGLIIATKAEFHLRNSNITNVISF